GDKDNSAPPILVRVSTKGKDNGAGASDNPNILTVSAVLVTDPNETQKVTRLDHSAVHISRLTRTPTHVVTENGKVEAISSSKEPTPKIDKIVLNSQRKANAQIEFEEHRLYVPIL